MPAIVIPSDTSTEGRAKTVVGTSKVLRLGCIGTFE
tara:strand:+ start:896 stop:1003 length:108 start_codon:yes stop_codon:yes gene_type:complete